MNLLNNLRYRVLEFLFTGYADSVRSQYQGQLEILRVSIQRFNAETAKYRRNNALLQSYQKDLMDAYSKTNNKPTA